MKKAIINPINDGKCFQYAPAIALNQKEIGKNLPFKNKTLYIYKCNWKGINYHQEKMTGKNLRKIIQRLVLMFCLLKTNIYPV